MGDRKIVAIVSEIASASRELATLAASFKLDLHADSRQQALARLR